MAPIRVLLLGDDPLARGGLAALLGREPSVEVTGQARLDEVAEAVEARYYPGQPPARRQPVAALVWTGVRFAAVAILLNLLLVPIYLILLVFPPLYLVVFYVVNGYLLGREYFELVAYRRLEERTADAMRRAFRGRLTLAGVVMALMLTIPVFNLVAPIAATAFALHLFEAMRREASLSA
jgi:uncharacterized protein involved in cysteine biosynthesis